MTFAPQNKISSPTFGIRHLQTLLIFLMTVVVFISRSNVAVAIVAMTNADRSNPNFPEYDWNEKQKSYILSSFFWGYVITQFPGGYLARRFGCKIVMFSSTFGSALFSLVTPFCIPWGGWQAFCGIRVMQGLFQGVMFPCIHEHLAKWSPPHERNRLGALSHTGILFGNVLATALTGIIAESSLGWPGISYISAGLCLIWCALWLVFAANNAQSSTFITPEERNYIELSLQRAEGFHVKKIPVPWRAIFTSGPFYALIVVRCTDNWGFSTILAEIPTYMNGVHEMKIKSNALFSSLPYLAMWICSYIYLISADVIIKKNWTSLTVIRKTFNTIASWVPAVGLIGVGFLDRNQKALAIAILAVGVGVGSGTTIGSTLNTIDLSPNHAGILMGIVNCCANFMSLMTPLFVGIIVVDETDRTRWQIVFLIAALVLFFGNLYYLIHGRTENQPWNAIDYLLPKDEENQKQVSNKNSIAALQNGELKLSEKETGISEKEDENLSDGSLMKRLSKETEKKNTSE